MEDKQNPTHWDPVGQPKTIAVTAHTLSCLDFPAYPLFACHLRQLYSTTDCVVVDEELKKALWDPSRQKALVSGRFADAGERLQESVWGQ